MLATLLVDLAGEKVAIRWVPPFATSAWVAPSCCWHCNGTRRWNRRSLAPSSPTAWRLPSVRWWLTSTLLSLLISWRYAEKSGTPVGEYAAILLAATLGAMLLCGATDLVSVFVSLETLSVASYLLSGYMKRDARSSEAALKYLLVGSAAAAVFLYGASSCMASAAPPALKPLVWRWSTAHTTCSTGAGVRARHCCVQNRCCALPSMDA